MNSQRTEMSQPKTRLMQLLRQLALATERAAHPGSTTNATITSVVALAAALVLVLGAVINWPYAYFQLLRVVVCGTCAYLALVAWGMEQHGWTAALVGVALLFNPFLTVGLSRRIWQVFDIVTAAFLIFAAMALSRARQK
jgi:hypothetical protein